MTSARQVSIAYAFVLLALTASVGTFLYAVTIVQREQGAPVVDEVSPVPPPVVNEASRHGWEIQDDFDHIGQIALPDEFDPPELYLPQESDAQRFALRVVEGASRDVERMPVFEVIIGGPGMYPPLRVVTDEAGEFAASLDVADMLDGEKVESIEVFVRELDRGRARPLGLWQEVRLDGLEEGSCAYGLRCKILTLWDALPMAVEVRDAQGTRLAHASVKLSSHSVGLVHLKESANSGGDVFFGGIPEGNYTLTIKAAGYLREEFEISHVSHELEGELAEEQREIVRHEVVLEEGRALYGRVVDAQGDAVSDAFVTVYVDRYGSPGMLSVENFSRIDSVPIRGVATTSEDGYFSVSGLPRGMAYVTAVGMLGVPALSAPLDLRELAEVGPVEVVLDDGSDVEVLVLGPDGPVGGVEVSWRDPQTGLRAKFVTRADGIAVFEDVPPGAMFAATIETWSARGRGLEAPDEDGVYRLTLDLERPGAREDITLRLLTPLVHPVSIAEMSFRAEDDGEVCVASKVERRDWMFGRCKPGRGWLEVRTRDHGTWVSMVDLDHGVIVTMPDPLDVEVVLRGWPTPPEVMQLKDVSEERRREVALEVLDRRGAHRVWRGQLYPGRYALSASQGGKRHDEVLIVEEERRALEWRLAAEHTLRVDLVDERDHPLRKSYFALVREHRHDDVRRDNASHIVPFTGDDVGQLTLLACGRTSGCVTHRVIQEDTTRERLLLKTRGDALKGAEALGGMSDEAEIAALLGAQLVRDHLRLLVDVRDPESVAAKLGIPRGASLVHVSRRGTSKGTRVEALVLIDDVTWKWLTHMIAP